MASHGAGERPFLKQMHDSVNRQQVPNLSAPWLNLSVAGRDLRGNLEPVHCIFGRGPRGWSMPASAT